MKPIKREQKRGGRCKTRKLKGKTNKEKVKTEKQKQSKT
jgi:hypothetical protein